MTDLQLSEHFHSSEFDCKGTTCHCGGNGDLMNPILIKLLEKLRADCGGRPIIILSGYRCPVHNAECDGSAKKSQHMEWNAADLEIPAGLSFEEFQWYVENTKTDDGYMFDGIGLYYSSYFIHVDVRDGGKHGGWYRW